MSSYNTYAAAASPNSYPQSAPPPHSSISPSYPAPVSAPAPAPRESEAPSRICFYDRNKPYYELTNFWEATISVKGREWPSTEHYFQGAKLTSSSLQEEVRVARRPRDAFDLTRTPRFANYIHPYWSSFKEAAMKDALVAKFTQHKDLHDSLMSTGSAQLIEDSPHDSYWGVGKNYDGQNRLGVLLMEVREEIRAGTLQPRFRPVQKTPTPGPTAPSSRAAITSGARSGNRASSLGPGPNYRSGSPRNPPGRAPTTHSRIFN